MIQSARAVPGGVTFACTTLTRPSMLVAVPSTSPKPAAASTTSAFRPLSVRNVSTAMTVPARVSARSARSRSGKSDSGSAPRRTSTSRVPSAAAVRMPVASSPGSLGTTFQRPLNQSRPDVERDTPGSTPGARPMSSAPLTLPRRSTGRNVVSGRLASSVAQASTTAAGDSASD